MNENENKNDDQSTSRRGFIQTTATAAVGAHMTLRQPFAQAATSANDTLKVGLVGCGRRGRGAAIQALKADANTRLVALGDAFEDQIDATLKTFEQHGGEVADRLDIPKQRCFVGFDAYQQVIDCADVIL